PPLAPPLSALGVFDDFDRFSGVLDEPSRPTCRAMSRVGDLERLGEGREAETFAWGEGQILRLMRDPSHAARLEREELALEAARRAGVPVPAVYGRRTLDGRPGMIMERVDGPDLLTVLLRQPWRLPSVARTL